MALPRAAAFSHHACVCLSRSPTPSTTALLMSNRGLLIVVIWPKRKKTVCSSPDSDLSRLLLMAVLVSPKHVVYVGGCGVGHDNKELFTCKS